MSLGLSLSLWGLMLYLVSVRIGVHCGTSGWYPRFGLCGEKPCVCERKCSVLSVESALGDSCFSCYYTFIFQLLFFMSSELKQFSILRKSVDLFILLWFVVLVSDLRNYCYM